MRVPDEEELFRFIPARDFEVRPDGSPKLRSSLFSQSTYPISVNLGSIWDRARNLEVAPDGYGLCSLTAGELRGTWAPESGKIPIEVVPEPLDRDPLLGIPNPSHASVNRLLTKSESRQAAAAASRNVARWPRLTA